MRILLVEDDPLVGDGVVTALKMEQHIVDWVHDGLSALHAYQDKKPLGRRFPY